MSNQSRGYQVGCNCLPNEWPSSCNSKLNFSCSVQQEGCVSMSVLTVSTAAVFLVANHSENKSRFVPLPTSLEIPYLN